MTREEEYDEIRTLLDSPKPGKPTPHAILSGMFATEQRQMNRLNNTGRAWSVGREPLTITTSSGRADYEIGRTDFGKLLYAYRTFSDNSVMPVPFTDYGTEINAPSLDLWMPTPRSGGNVAGRKIAVYRTDSGEAFIRIFPVPQSAESISLLYATGAINGEDFIFEEYALMSEFSRHRCLQTALFLLPRAEWEGYSRGENREKRMELREAMSAEFAMEEKEFDQYSRNPSHETAGTVGYWFD